MSRYRAGIDAVRAHNRSLWVVIVLLMAIIAAQLVATSQIPREIRLRYPPELRSGAVLRDRESTTSRRLRVMVLGTGWVVSLRQWSGASRQAPRWEC